MTPTHKPAEGDIVEIWWLDSCARGRWDTESEYRKWAVDSEGLIHRSVGFLLYQSDESVAIVQSSVAFTDGEKNVAEAMSIPRAAIRSIELLKAKDGQKIAIEPLSRTDNPSEELARLALDWRRAERAYQHALTGEQPMSDNADMALAKLAGDANKALRTALDERIAADA
jgi:hypothetical protein